MYESEVGADAHEQRLVAMRSRLRQLSADQARCSLHSPQYEILQSQIDDLTQRMIDYEQVVPDLQADERAARRSVKLATALALIAAVVGLAAAQRDTSEVWWFWVVTVVTGLLAVQQLVYAAYRWFR